MSNYKYFCKNCCVNTNSRQTYDRHILSKRHLEVVESNNFIFLCNYCNKKFKGNTGLWQHSKKCNVQQEEEKQEIQIQEITIPQIDVIALNEKVDKIADMLVDIRLNPPSQTVNLNNQQNINVNMLLNEHFNQAKNLMDIINDIPLANEYEEYISSADYVESIATLIKNEIDKLPMNQRPIQCIQNEDSLQQIIHIRHNDHWSKETELEWTQRIHNYYLDDHDEPVDENKNIIFYAIKKLEENIITKIQRLYQHSGKKLVATKREYKCEMDYVPNKFRIIKSIIQHVNINKNELSKLIDNAYTTGVSISI